MKRYKAINNLNDAYLKRFSVRKIMARRAIWDKFPEFLQNYEISF